jgi:hypothetical protein
LDRGPGHVFRVSYIFVCPPFPAIYSLGLLPRRYFLYSFQQHSFSSPAGAHNSAHPFLICSPPDDEKVLFLPSLEDVAGASKTIYPCLRSTPSDIFCPRAPRLALPFVMARAGIYLSVLVLTFYTGCLERC